MQRKDLVNTYKIAPGNKVFTIPLGFNLEKYSIEQDNKRINFRDKYGFDTNEIIIGIIGRIVPIKNHEMFIEVASLIKKKWGHNVRFAIVGDGASLPAIEQKSSALGLSYSYFPDQPKLKTDIVVTSWDTEIDRVMAGLDIVALTSYNEGTPVSLIEAQAACKPVVSTNVGGVEDIITHGHNGFLTSVNDAQSFANYVNILIGNKGLRNKMGKTGYETVINRYSRQRLIRDVKSLYMGFLEKNISAVSGATMSVKA